MEELMKVGYKTISKDENGNPASIWCCSVKRGHYGPFIAVEKHWVQKYTKEGKILQSKYAGKRFNFPIDSVKATAMITSIHDLVMKAVKLTESMPEFKTLSKKPLEAGAEYYTEEF